MEFAKIIAIMSSPWIVGAAIVACWSPVTAVLIGLGSIIGLVWLLGMCGAAEGN